MAQFPVPPNTDGDTHEEGGVSWVFDGEKWVKQDPTITTGDIELTDPTHPANLSTNPSTLPIIPADTTTQFGANKYFMSALSHLDDLVRGIHVGDTPPSEYNNGTLWFDSTDEELTLYMFYDPDNNGIGVWVPASPPTSLDGVNQQIEEALTVQSSLLSRVDDGEILQETLRSTIESSLQTQADIEDTVSTSILTQNGIKTEVAALHNKVEALEGAVIDAKYDLSTLGTPAVGEFQLYASGTETLLWDQADSIKLYRTDAGGNPHTFDPVGLGDIIRIGGQSGSAVYEVTSLKTQDGDTFAFDITVSSFTGTMVAETEYEFTLSPAFDASAYVTKTYVDAQDDLKLNLTGGNLSGTLRINGQINNDDSLRFYMRDKDGNDNLTLYPSGLVVSNNNVRVVKNTGDCFQIKDTSNSVKWKVDADGVNTVPKIVLTGGAADVNERVIDVKQGEVGRLAYDSLTKMSWGASNVWIGSTTTTGEDDVPVTLNLQGNPISNVGTFELNHTGQVNGNKFVIKGETEDGEDEDVFYSYKNTDGTSDAVNYKGRMTNEFNIVNKGYVDTQIASIDLDGSDYMPTAGGTFTGKVTFNSSGNDQVNFAHDGNNNIQYKNSWIVSFQTVNNKSKIKLNTDVNCDNNSSPMFMTLLLIRMQLIKDI